MAQNILTPGTLAANFPFSPALLGSSPHPGAKKSPYGAALVPSLSNLGLLPNFDSPSGSTGAKYLASYLAATDPTALQAPIAVVEDPKKRALENVLRILAKRPGRIGEDGVERLAKRAGMQFYRDDMSNKGVHMLSISGTIVVVDIDFKDSKVSRVGVSFAETPGAASDLAHLAAAILEKTLIPKTYPLTSSLAAFADNIERLARLDRLSSLPALNCFSVIANLYTDLRTEWDKEVSLLSEREAMCKGNGRPAMHARGLVGLSIDYWKERSMIPSTEKGKGKGASTDEEGKFWRVIIELEEMAGSGFMAPTQPSQNWGGENVIKSEEDAMFDDLSAGNDWNTQPAMASMDTLMGTEADQQNQALAPPMVQYIAKLDPPIIVSLQDELEIFNAAGIAALPQSLPASLDQLLYPRLDIASPLQKERSVWMDAGESVKQVYTLNSLQPYYGRVLEEIPFSDPKQLWKIFQILRKYALFTSLFHSAFGVPTKLLLITQPPQPPNPQSPPIDDFDSFLDGTLDDGPASSSSQKTIQIDISLSDDPLGFSLLVPTSSPSLSSLSDDITLLEVQVTANGELVVNTNTTAGDVGKVAEMTEDLGITVQYIRMKSQ